METRFVLCIFLFSVLLINSSTASKLSKCPEECNQRGTCLYIPEFKVDACACDGGYWGPTCTMTFQNTEHHKYYYAFHIINSVLSGILIAAFALAIYHIAMNKVINIITKGSATVTTNGDSGSVAESGRGSNGGVYISASSKHLEIAMSKAVLAIPVAFLIYITFDFIDWVDHPNGYGASNSRYQFKIFMGYFGSSFAFFYTTILIYHLVSFTQVAAHALARAQALEKINTHYRSNVTVDSILKEVTAKKRNFMIYAIIGNLVIFGNEICINILHSLRISAHLNYALAHTCLVAFIMLVYSFVALVFRKKFLAMLPGEIVKPIQRMLYKLIAILFMDFTNISIHLIIGTSSRNPYAPLWYLPISTIIKYTTFFLAASIFLPATKSEWKLLLPWYLRRIFSMESSSFSSSADIGMESKNSKRDDTSNSADANVELSFM